MDKNIQLLFNNSKKAKMFDFQELLRELNQLESLEQQIDSITNSYDLKNFDKSQIKDVEVSLRKLYENVTKIEN